MTYRFPIFNGDRVALAPHTDMWMRGMRFGTVTEQMVNEEGVRTYLVRFHADRSEWMSGEDLLGATGPTPEGAGASPSTEQRPDFDAESNDYALSDCVWWDEPVQRRPWWAKGDCAGPRVGDTAHGVMCEHHFNAIP